MFMIRTYTFNLTIIGILFVFMLPLTGLAERPTNIYSSPNAEGQIGISEKAPLDNPFDNIFHVDITDELCGNETVWLTYELEGVADHSAISRSINDQIAFGGYLIKKHEGWTAQREQINVNWLREGDNVIRFSVPGEAEHSYKVRNLSIEIGASEEALMEGVVFNQPTLNYFGDKAYVKGYLQGQSGTLQIDGKKVKTFNGEFELIIKKPQDSKEETWTAQAEVAYEDGTSVCETIVFSNSVHADYAYALETGSFKTERLFKTKTAQYLSLAGASIDVSAGALNTPVFLSITTLRDVDVPALDAGMVNVTAKHSGYRYLPHGTAFQEAAKLILPYDADKIPSGYTEKDIKTYFFDEQSHHWVPLPLDSVVVGNGEVWSRTMHFTDMINGIIQVPESPEVNAYNSTSMKGIKAANPTAGINLMQPPSANSMGGANMGYPLNLPAGRNGIQPQLSLSYNNGGGNSWMGLGWNLTIPSITIDTRWGVPRYDSINETETYTLNGQQLSPVAHRGDLGPRTGEKIFHPRVEGSFQRIVRHGSTPSTYWWEVTDKSGVIYIYGKDDAAVLTDGSGNRASWCLQEVRDLNQNFVKYHYTKQEDTGLANGSVPGQEIYVSKITYTGHGSTEGKYSVDFIRDRDLGEAKRLDVSIDARLGFKRVTADLLRKVEVKFNNNIIRHYEFGYEPGAFFKTLLTTIKEFDAAGNLFTTHDLEYYDDVKAVDGYSPFVIGDEIWNTGTGDDVNGGFLDIGEFNDNASALSGTNSRSIGGGMSVTIGPNDFNYASKSNTAGMNFGFSNSKSEGRVSMMDLNGDGLPDKVIMITNRIGGSNKTMKYRPQLPPDAQGNVTFGEAVLIEGVTEFLKEKSNTFDIGLEANFGVFIGNNLSLTKSTTSIYFSDVNGDGLPDIVRNGSVKFNSLNAAGHPKFTTTSAETPNPLGSGGAIDPNLVEQDPNELEELIDQNPLHDVVRMWRAPFDGEININAPVTLVKNTTEEREEYTTADGVRASIQFKGQPVLWEKVIEANDYSTAPANVTVSVQKGDQIYFRVQSRYDGAYDQVIWNPVMTYQTHTPDLVDANNKTIYQFNAFDDYLLASSQSVGLPIDGEIHIESTFIKPITTDSVTVEIIRGLDEVLVTKAYAWNETANDIIEWNGTVSNGEQLRFKVSTNTNIDWKQISWNPYMYYTVSHDPEYPEVMQNGEPMLEMRAVPEYSLYAETINESIFWEVEEDDTVSVNSLPRSLHVTDAKMTFTIKKINELLSQQTYTIIDSMIVATNGDAVINELPVKAGDKIYFEFHTKHRTLGEKLKNSQAMIYFSQGDSLLMEAGVHTIVDPESFIFGNMYRHWGMFVYNGNRDRATSPINEGELRLEKFENQPGPIDLGNATTKDQMDNSFDDAGGFRANKENFIYMVASANDQAWIGNDNLTYIVADTMSSSRMGLDQLEVILSTPGAGSGATGIDKITKSRAISLALGASAVGVNGSDGNSRVITDFMDMNGDRYPDILSESKIQYTMPAGGLEETATPHNYKINHFTKTLSGGASVSGGYSSSKKEASRSAPIAAFSAGGESVSLSASKLWSTDKARYSWMDINGDGLPDRVNAETNQVALNIGYGFTAEEVWHDFAIREGKGENTSGGLGISLYNGSIQAGVGFGVSDNKVEQVLQDVNGDGLPDKIEVDGGDVWVSVNTGNGFASPKIKWGTITDAGIGAASSRSANVAFTIGIPLVPPPLLIKLAFNPKTSFSQSFNRQKTQLSDIDGDGFPDYLSSAIDSELKVKRSTIGRTNMLKTVQRPLGASFTVDYKPEGSTYENPNTIWTLSKVEITDGFANDGVDTMRTVFAYENGFYERHEREFYGFDKVTTQSLETDKGNAPYTIVTQNFENSTYYNKGLLLSETMTDAAGNKFVEKENTYVLKDIVSGNSLPADFSTDNGTAFPAMIATSQKFFEGQEDAGKSTSMAYVYNKIGNVTSYTDFGDTGDEDDLIAAITYHDYDGPYIKGTPKSIVVDGVDRTYRKREADIDASTGNVTEIRQYLEDETVAVHELAYDDYGNLEKMTRPANANDQHLSVDYEYDNEVQTYVTKVGNSYGYSSSATYDFSFGQVLESIDLNGNKISYLLDDLGRVNQITGPYEQQGAPFTIKFEYHPEATVPWALTQHYDPQNKNNNLETAIFVDGLGRVLQTKKDAAIYQGEGKPDKEMMIVSGRVSFDAFGRTTEAFYPTSEAVGNPGNFNGAFDTVDPTLTSYDVLNRALSVTLPDGALTRTEYGFGSDRDGKDQFRTSTTDANSIVTQQFTDVRGRVTAVKNITSDGDVWTSFTYNAINEQLSATDDMDNTTLSAYDWFGRRIERIHPDAGTTSYFYDLAGNLTSLITANLATSGGAIDYSYDFERLTDITYPDNQENNVHYTYGDAGAEENRAGRIVIQEDASGAQEFFYGPLGEVIKNIRTVVIPKFDEQTFVTEWKYDTWNRLESMIYADGEEVSYHYNVGGLLNSMDGKKKGASYNYVQQLGYDKFEQRVYLEYGNGTKTNYDYEPDRRRLKSMTSATASNRNFMDNVYEYDQVNNILGLKNNAPVPSNNLMGGSSDYSYEYDDLYRLVKAEGKYNGTGDNESHAYSLEMSYNTVGGITRKNQLHTNKGQEQKKTTYDMAYTYGDDQPHAPTHIGKQAYGYDANGNQTSWTHDVSGQRRDILWDEENRIRAISDNGANYHYVYDASGTRVIKGKSNGQSVYVNGEWKTGSGSMGNYTVYVNPYIVLKSGGYTKHYYIEGQRIVSKLGGGLDNNGKGPLKAGEGKVNYSKKHDELFEGIVRNLKWLAEDGSILTAGKSGKIPPGQIIGNSPGNGGTESFQYFYHPDHLGSTSYITDASGEVYQHLEYFAFGETFVEEHSNTDRTPYLFNGKELDEETGLYYYGARYYDAQTSIWLSVDNKAEKYPGWSPYAYALNNPINLLDPDGNEAGPAPNIIPLVTSRTKTWTGKSVGVYTKAVQPYWVFHQSPSNLMQRAERLKNADNVNKVIGQGNHPVFAIASELLNIPISIEKGKILNEAYKMDLKLAEIKQFDDRSKEANKIMGNIDIANKSGVFGDKLSENSIMDLTNFEMLSKYGDSDNMSNYKSAFVGGNSDEYLQNLRGLSEQFKSDMEADKPRVINLNKLDGPPNLQSIQPVKYDH
jgi:RHS repeat-associated protein